MRNTFHGDENGRCVLDETKNCTDCCECDKCDLNPAKICDNCGKCIDFYNTNEKGFVEIPIDRIDMSGGEPSLEDFYKQMGLDAEDDEE